VYGSAFAGGSNVDGDAHVLLVDADADTAEMYSVGLRLDGFLPSIALDVVTAARSLRRETPGAIVANVDASDGDTWTWLRTIHAQPATAAVPVVLIADRGDVRVSDQARAHGWALLTKPCLPDALADAVRHALAHREAQR
jgi:two-component system phosphate regulon response regulator PhoB